MSGGECTTPNCARFGELVETYEAAGLEKDIRDDLIDCMSKAMCEMGVVVEVLYAKLEAK